MCSSLPLAILTEGGGGIGVMTVSVAVALLSVPAVSVTSTKYVSPLLMEERSGVVYWPCVAPDMDTPLVNHWNERGVCPVAVTVNKARVPLVAVAFCGWTVMTGSAPMVSVAVELVTGD